MPFEVGTLQSWLYGTLGTACAAISLGGTPVYSPIAPEAATFPLYLYAGLNHDDINALSPRRTHTVHLVKVAAVMQGQSVTGGTPSLATMMGTADALLQGASVIYGGYKIDVLREKTLGPDTYVESGHLYTSTALVYRVWMQPT